MKSMQFRAVLFVTACLCGICRASTTVCYTNDTGQVRYLFIPSEDNIQRVPMLPVREDVEFSLPEAAVLGDYPDGDVMIIRAELDRYSLKPYIAQLEEDDPWACLVYVSKFGGKKRLPMIVYIPGNGEISADLANQFRQSDLFEIVTSEGFQKKHPCHLIALSPPKCVETFCATVPGLPNGAHRGSLAMIKGVRARNLDMLVDDRRIYVVGFSYGGAAATMLKVIYPVLLPANYGLVESCCSCCRRLPSPRSEAGCGWKFAIYPIDGGNSRSV